MSFFLQLIGTGLSLGSIYGVIGICIVLIFRSTGVFNFAQGMFLVIGAFMCWTFITVLHFPAWLSFVITLVLAGILGLVIERLAFRPMIGQPILAAILMTVSLMAVLKGFTLLIWGGENQAYQPPILPQNPAYFGDVVLSQGYLWGFGVAVVMVGLFIYFFRRTRHGLVMSATSEDHQLARGIGIPVGRVFSLSWIIAAAASAAVGIILANLFSASLELELIGLKAFAVVILGGLESIPGALLAGLIIGLSESMAAGYIDPLVGGGIRDVFPFIVAIVVLVFRPHGLFGWKRIERV